MREERFMDVVKEDMRVVGVTEDYQLTRALSTDAMADNILGGRTWIL